MKKYLFILIAALAVFAGAKAEITADWKMHMPFDRWPMQVVETPKRVYMLNRTFEKNKWIPERNILSHSLFYYDKDADQLVSVNERANSNGNAVSCISFNSTDKYLLVAYTDCNVDFLYDNGKVYNVPALQITSIPGRKEVNSIIMDPANQLAYMATSFGYVTLNDKRHEVAESRNYGVDVSSVGRSGDNIILASEGKLYYAPAAEKRFNFSDYKEIEGAPAIDKLILYDEGDFFYGYPDTAPTTLYRFTPKAGGNGYEWEELFGDPGFHGSQHTYGGQLLSGYAAMYSLPNSGDITTLYFPQEDWGNPATTLTVSDYWTLQAKKGLRHYKRANSQTTPVGDYIRPNSPATYVSTSTLYHPKYGMMVGSNGHDMALSEFAQSTPNNISVLSGGFWKEYGPDYRSPGKLANPNNYSGLAIDPADSRYVWRSDVLGGLMRINMENPDDLLVMANPSNANANSPGFIKVADDLQASSRWCKFSTPTFTADGTMWTFYADIDDPNSSGRLYYWPKADRMASNSAATYRPMKYIKIPKFVSSSGDKHVTLSKNPTMVVIGGFGDLGSFIIYDHRGTLDNTSDDRYLFYNHPVDQDGSAVSFLNVNDLFEDPNTGVVWVLSQRGVFTVNPATAFDNPNQVNRIKVARNDGTNLADYLLNEINVTHLSVDGEGRKWFSTSNGLVCTSADGRTILGEFTTENSFLPDDRIYSTGYNPETNSLMVTTDKGVVEMFPSGSGSAASDGQSKMRVFPNPVEPDFYGWVRIDNIADGSLVKITDSRGGIVKELGPAQGGSVQWDITGINQRRVSTGVYYVMVSPGSNGGSSEVSKILVLN